MSDTVPQKNSKNTGFSDQEICNTFGWSSKTLDELKADLISRYRKVEWETNNDGAVNLRVSCNKVLSDQLTDEVFRDWAERFGTTHGLSTEGVKLRIFQVLRARKNHLEGEERKKSKARKRKAKDDAPGNKPEKKHQGAATGGSSAATAAGDGSGHPGDPAPGSGPENTITNTGHREYQQEITREIHAAIQNGLASQNQGSLMSTGTVFDPSMVDTFAQKFLTCALQKSEEPDLAMKQLTERCKNIMESTVK